MRNSRNRAAQNGLDLLLKDLRSLDSGCAYKCDREIGFDDGKFGLDRRLQVSDEPHGLRRLRLRNEQERFAFTRNRIPFVSPLDRRQADTESGELHEAA